MDAVDGGRRDLSRSRWAAIGAAVAVSLGAGGIVAVNAASSSPSSVVTIDPVRILDTRDPINVGLAGPFVSAVSQKLKVTGAVPTSSGTQTPVPAGATGVLLNVTVVNPSAAGFLSVRPGDATGAPSTSSLNFTAGDIVPNSVQVGLPTTGANAGQIDITYDAFGQSGPTTEVLIDVVGYMVAGGAGTGPPGPPGPPGTNGATPARVLWVATAKGDYTKVSDALAAIGTTLPASSASVPYVIKVAPGTYTETATLVMKDYVDLEGSSQNTTTITCACGSATNPQIDAGARVTLRAAGPNLHTEIRNIKIVNTGGNLYSIAILTRDTSAGELSIRNISVTATGGTGSNVGVENISSSPSMADMTILASGGNDTLNVGFYNYVGGSTTLTNVSATGSGGDANGALISSGTVLIRDSYFEGTNKSIYRNSGNVRVLNTVFNGVTSGLTGMCINGMTTGLTTYNCT